MVCKNPFQMLYVYHNGFFAFCQICETKERFAFKKKREQAGGCCDFWAKILLNKNFGKSAVFSLHRRKFVI
jgi:hypothetical protein